MPILERQSTTLLGNTGDFTYTSRPFVSATRGELSIATLVWEITTCVAQDSSPFVQVGALPIACPYGWLLLCVSNASYHMACINPLAQNNQVSRGRPRQLCEVLPCALGCSVDDLKDLQNTALSFVLRRCLHAWEAQQVATGSCQRRSCGHAQIGVTITAHADKGWLWGVRGMLESVFISQAKTDVEAYINYTQDIFAGLLTSGKACLLLFRKMCLCG